MFGAKRTTEMNTPENPFCINCQDASYGQFPWQLSLQAEGFSWMVNITFVVALSYPLSPLPLQLIVKKLETIRQSLEPLI